MDAVLAVVVGVAAGAVSGLLGVGGGILFVPALALLLGLSQLHAEATSLLAMIPVVVVGTWRQRGYGNVRLRDGLLIGAMSLAGVAVGTVVANEVPQHALRIAFAGLLVVTAVRMAWGGLRPHSGAAPEAR